jgi:hypothetical protein
MDPTHQTVVSDKRIGVATVPCIVVASCNLGSLHCFFLGVEIWNLFLVLDIHANHSADRNVRGCAISTICTEAAAVTMIHLSLFDRPL